MKPNIVRDCWSRGMIAVLAAQFLSAMADNALLFGALALLRIDRYPAWTEPLLQEFFVGAYILLAPFAGPFADALPKGRVMLIANGLKLLGALGMWMGLNPFLAYGLVGARRRRLFARQVRHSVGAGPGGTAGQGQRPDGILDHRRHLERRDCRRRTRGL